jgi:hypothetical protein
VGHRLGRAQASRDGLGPVEYSGRFNAQTLERHKSSLHGICKRQLSRKQRVGDTMSNPATQLPVQMPASFSAASPQDQTPYRQQYQKGIYAAYNASGPASAQFGIAAIKTGLLLNGGALVALLAFAAQVIKNENAPSIGLANVFAQATWFVIGLCGSVMSFVSAYLYQSTTTKAFQVLADRSTDAATPMTYMVPETRERTWCRLAVFGSVIATYFFFVVGAGSALHSLEIAIAQPIYPQPTATAPLGSPTPALQAPATAPVQPSNGEKPAPAAGLTE